jgi:ubiquitin-conjugating enzyme E2 A
MAFCTNRLTKELNKIKEDPIEGFALTNVENLMIWQGELEGPKDTPYENNKFKLQISFDEEYPLRAPSVKYLQFIFHPNIYKDGKICVDILQSSGWSPALSVRTIIQSLRSLFMDPNPASPANREAAELFLQDIELFNNKVKEFIKKNF